jgi:hypothetical protein
MATELTIKAWVAVIIDDRLELQDIIMREHSLQNKMDFSQKSIKR